MLEELVTRGLALRVVTSKPTVFACEVVEHFGLTRWFAGAARIADKPLDLLRFISL